LIISIPLCDELLLFPIHRPGCADRDNRRDFPGGFPGDASNAFDRAGRSPEQQEVFEYDRRLIHIRHQTEPLRIGALRELAIGDKTYVYARQTAKNSAVILLNNGDRPATMNANLAGIGPRDGAALSDQLGTGLQVAAETSTLGGARNRDDLVTESIIEDLARNVVERPDFFPLRQEQVLFLSPLDPSRILNAEKLSQPHASLEFAPEPS
jgi:hypothetical protein